MKRVDRDRIRGLRGKSAEAEADPTLARNSHSAARTGDVIIEFVSQGSYVRVCAVDVASGVEAAIVGDPSVGEEALKRLALQKLDYITRTRRRGL